jgi:hypothetical protein
MEHLNKNIFAGHASVVGVSAQKSMVELYNPPGSGVVLKVTGIFVSVENTGDIAIAHHNAVLADNGANSKRSGNRYLSEGPAPNGEIYWETNAALLGTEIARLSLFTVSEVPEKLNDREFYVEEGFALLVGYSTNTNLNLHASFEWEEL